MVGKVLYIKYKKIVDGQIVEKVRYAVDRWQADDKYMGESFITFTVKSSKPIAFSVGDYCEYRGETYTLNYIPSVSQRANIGGSGEAFVYDQVKMDSPREELDRAIMLDVTPTTGDYIAALGTNYTGSAQFQLYCGETTANGRTLTPVCALAAKMQANLDRAFPDKGWKVLVDTTSTHEEAGQQVLNTHSDEKTLTFDNTTIANALAEVKNTFEIDFAVKGRTVYIGYTFGAITGNDDGDYYYFGYGKGYLSEDNQGKALFELKRTSDSGQKIVTRLRALGSTKNMPYRYYNKKYNLSQSMFPTNLQLPDTFETPEVKAKHNKERKAVYPWIRDVLGDTNDAYIDKNDNCLDTVEGLREDCMRWDGTNADLKEIYPSIEEVTYGELRAALCEDQDGNKGASAFPYYGDNERVDEILDIDTDTNVGDGILTESDSSKQTAFDTDVRLSSSETASSLVYMGSGYISEEKEVMNISSQYAGNYIISNSHLWFRASYSLGRHQSEAILKTCKVAYQIKVYAKDLSTNKESVICTYISDYKLISNRGAREYEVEVAKLPDVDAEVQKVDKITVTNPSDIRITFALIVKDIDYSYDQWYVNWNLGLSLYQNPDTDTEWTPSLIWDLEGSASTFMKNPFHVYVKDMGFDFVAAFGTSDTPKIAMKSGMCVAREFAIGNNPQKVEYTKNGITYKAWRLTLAKAEDSSLKTYYPSENFPLAAGDNFVIIGIEMPDVYIQAASMKLLVEATKALADVCDTKHEYEPSVDDIYIQRNYDRCEEQGDVTKSVYWKLGAGMKFPFFGIAEEGKETPDMFSMIIDTLSIREGEGLTPKISIKLSEDFQQSTLQKLTRTVTSITNGSIFKATSIGNGGGLDESSVRAIVSEFTKRRYLSKLNDDVAAGIITFLKGTNWGNFTSETGAAMTIDPITGQTYMEVDRLKVRLKAFFEQLEVQKVGYVGGKIVVSKGQGVDILDVEEIYDSEGNLSAYRCYFLGEQEGRRINNLLRVDDQMICKDENISEGSTDGATNKYYWRLVTAVSSDVVKRGNNVCHWVDLSATDYDTISDNIPEIGDTICQLGNRTDINRQGAEVLSVVDANSPSFTIYAGIDSYSLVNKEYIDMGVSEGKAYCDIYGSTYIGDRERKTGYLRWNDDTKTFEIKGTIDISSPLSSGGTIGGAIDNAANAYKDDFSSFTSNVNEIIGGFQAQIDGVIETWFYDPEPTLGNPPASEWKDNDTKDRHLGDLYYSKDGYAYRFQKEGDIYKWIQIDDTAITSALKEAKEAKDAAAAAQGTADSAQTTANSKMKVFVNTPTDSDEYSIGDMWVNATYPADGSTYSNEILKCKEGKAAGAEFRIAHWEKASKYTDDTAAKAAQATANNAAAAAQSINNAINAIDDNVDVALKDKIITKTEAAAIGEALNSLSAIMADVTKTYAELVNNDVYNLIAADIQQDFDDAYAKLVATFNALSDYITNTLTKANPITSEILSTYNTHYTNFKADYEAYVSKLNVVRNSMDALLNTRIGDIASMLGGLKATTDAMDETTQINGGLILSTLLALGYTDGNKVFNVMSGVSGLYESDTEKGGGIAFWAGGHRIDINDCTKNADGTYSLGGKVVNPADFLVRHDGTGYAAGGALWWEKDGKVHADPQSFIINKQYVGNVMQLFEFGYSGGTAFENIIHAIPQKPFESLSVGANGLTLYNGEKTAKLYIKNGVLFIEGDLAVTGGITMYASDGVKSGMIDQVYAVLDQSLFSIVDGVITITGEIGSGTVKGIAIKGTQYDPDTNGIIALTLNWGDLTGVPETFTPSAHTHDDRYYIKSDIDTKLSGKSNTGHTHDDRYYTESEMDTMLGGKSDTSHTHSLKINGVTKIIEATGGTAVDLGTYLTVHQPIYALTISGKGTNTFTYTPNSSDAALTITPAWIGAPTTSGTGATGTWGISISGNAATATKLAATKTLWGQNFDGSVNVSGNMSSVGSITPTGDTLKIVGNLVVTGGITMYATDGTFDSAFGQQLANYVDGTTIKFINDKLVAVNNGNVTSVIISGTEYKPTDGVITLPDLFAPSAHTHSIADVNGLQGVLDAKLDASFKGVANGLATLDASGKVPSAQLPSYVDDVLEYTNKASFPTTGESGKIYIDQTTNLTYRWGGTAYTEISQSLALGETSSTAYAGDKGKKNATDIAALKTDKADKATTLAGYGITDAYTKTQTYTKTEVNTKLTDGSVTKIGTADVGSATKPIYLKAGVPTAVGTSLAVDITGNSATTSKLKTAVTLWGQSFDGSKAISGAITGASDITMSGALKLNGITIEKTSNGLLKINGDLIVTGGITMYASDGVSSGLMEQILVDGVTISKNSDGALYAINTGNVRTIKMGTVEYTPNDSGVVELPAKVTWDNIDGKPSTFTPSSHTHTFASLTSKPTTLSGYGITDAKIANGVITLGTATITPLTAHQKVTLASGTNNGTLKLTVNGSVTDNIAVKGLGSAAFTASSAYAAASHTHSQYLVAASLDGYVNALTDNTSANVFVTAISKSGKTLSYTKSFTKKSLSAVGHSGWTSAEVDALIIPDMSFIAHWNGAYNASGNSNLAYCAKGAFGDMATASKSSYYSKTEVNTKLTDGSVTKVGTATVGATNVPIYLKAGVPTAVTLVDTANNLINNLTTGTSTPEDADYYVAQYVGGGTTTTTFHRRPHSALYAYIKGKAEGTWAISVSGNAATATKLGTANVGSGTQHFYLNGGTATASTSTVGGTAKPMYLKSGVMTAISDTIGSASLPVYLNAGTITACSTTLGVSITGNAATATTLQNARTLWGQSFNGSANISGNMSGVGQITFSALSGTNGRALLYQQMADNDYFRIYCGGTASNGGYVEIATADDGNEPIYVRQYSGVFGTLVRTLTLLDGNGNTTVPGLLTAANGTVNGTLKVGAIPVTNSSTGVLKIDGNLIVTGGITMYATDGVASGLMEQILVDGVTIDKDANGRLYAINTGNVRSIIMGSTTYTPNDSGAVTLPEKVTWANIEGKPSTFTPSSHTHAISQITNLQATLDGKAAASHTHSDYVTALGTNGNYLTWTKNGSTSNITVPYAVSATYANGIANKGTLDSQEKIDNFITANRFEYATFKTTDSNNVGFASNDGMILSIPWGGTAYGAQMAFDDTTSGTVKVRCKGGSWGSWYTLLHSGNYNDYAPSKTGTGASGTWGINISGNATYASSAGSVAWGNITGKPSSFTPSSHTHDYLPLAGGTLTGHLKLSGTKNLSSPWDPGVIAGSDGHNKVVLTYLASSTNAATIGAHNSSLNDWAPLYIGGTSVYIGTRETKVLTVSSSQNVGIGNTNPSSYKLEVNGDTYSTGYVRAASGFIKGSSSNDYALLGGGGHSHLSNLQWFTWEADLSSLSNINYYPVLVNGLPYMRRIKIRINGENQANFSEREDGKCYIWLTEEISGSGWSGNSGLSRIIHGHEEWGGNGKAILVKISQMTNSSCEVFWLRGGSKYNISSNYYGLSITCGENSYTYNSQTVTYIQGLQNFIRLTEASDSYEGTVTGAKVWYASNADKVDGHHATDGRTFNGNINWSENWNDVWSDGTNNHPWYGFDHRYPNTGAYSTTITDYYGMTIKTSKTLRLDFGTLLINGTSIYSINVASATKLQTPRTIWGQSFDGTANIDGMFSGSKGMKINGVWIGLNTNSESRNQTIDCDGYDNLYLNYYRAKHVITNHAGGNLGVGIDNPAYKLHVAGDIYTTTGFKKSGSSDSYVLLGGGGHKAVSDFATSGHTHSYLPLSGGTMTGTINANDGVQNTGIKFKSNNANLNALSNQHLILGSAIRFGAYNTWDWNVWAGLKYDSSSKTIYLGIADGTVFNANSAQTGGTLSLPAISTVKVDKNTRIAQASASLYIGSSSNTGYVYLQDMASQSGTTYWKLTQNGYLTAKGVTLSETFTSSVSSGTYLDAYNGNAIINSTAAAGFNMLARMKSTNGVFIHGVYDNSYGFYYAADGAIGDGTNEVSESLLSLGEDGYVRSNNLLPLGTNKNIGSYDTRWNTGYFINAVYVGAKSTNASAGGANAGKYGNGYIELSLAAPYIDFHYAKNTANYTSRIVATAADCLSISSHLYVGGTSATSYTFRVEGNAFAKGIDCQGWFSVLDGSGNVAARITQAGDMVVSGGITMYSDVRKKDIISDKLLSVKSIADAPLFAFNYKSDEAKRLHTGTSAQYWHGAYGDMFGYKDEEGFYTLEYQNLGVAMGISLAREIVKYESKTDKKIRLMKKKINDLEARIKELEGSMEERRTA